MIRVVIFMFARRRNDIEQSQNEMRQKQKWYETNRNGMKQIRNDIYNKTKMMKRNFIRKSIFKFGLLYFGECGYNTLKSIPGHLLWRLGFVEVGGAPSVLWMPRMSRWLFPAVTRIPVERGHSGFSNSFTYEWVVRVGLKRREEWEFSSSRGWPGEKSSARRCPGFGCQLILWGVYLEEYTLRSILWRVYFEEYTLRNILWGIYFGEYTSTNILRVRGFPSRPHRIPISAT